MVDTDDNRESIVRRLRGSQRTLTVVVMVLVLVGSATVVVAAPPQQANEFTYEYWADFEDGSLNDWGGGDGEIVEDSFEDTYSMELREQDQGGISAGTSEEIDISEGNSIYYRHKAVGELGDPLASEFRVSGESGLLFDVNTDGDVYPSDTDADIRLEGPALDGGSEFQIPDITSWHDVYIDIIPTNGNEYTVDVYVWESGTSPPESPQLTETMQTGDNTASPNIIVYNNEMFRYDEIGMDSIPQTGVEGTVSSEEGGELEGVTVEASQGGTVENSATTNSLGQYELSLDDGTYNVTASKQGWYSETETVDVQGDIVTQDFTLQNHSAALQIDTRPFLEHGETAPYSVVYTNRTQDGEENREDVTDSATVTSNDTDVLIVNTASERIEATEDTSVNNRTYLEAEYTTGGETYTTQYNVTVANETVENLGILPPVSRFSASITDTNMQVIIIAAATGAAASIIATAFAGVAAMTMVMMMGWIAGYVGNGMAMVTVFIALFVGLNVAGNVDYTVRR